MKKLIFVALLAGCAAAPPPPQGSRAPSYPLLCEAEHARICPRSGCDAGHQGEGYMTPISVSVSAHANVGRFCIGESCSNARFTEVPEHGLNWTANIAAGPDMVDSMGDINIAPDRQSFTLTRTNTDGTSTVWEGYCRANGS